MTPIVNPFGNRAMIADPRDFFGRRREVEQLLGRVLGGSKAQSCSVVGQRRIGKSSLFRRLEAVVHERDPRTAVAYYDLEAARKLSAGKFYATVLRRLRKAAGETSPAGVEEAAAYDALVDLLEQSEGRRRFVLLLDEFDTVTSNPSFDADFFGSLRALANNYDLAFVTSSYEDLTDLCHAEEVRQSPFFNVFTTLDLGPMPQDEVREMTDELLARAPFAATAAERAWLAELGGRYPFFVQVAGAALCEAHAAARGDRIAGAAGTVTREEVEAAFRREAEGHFRYFVDHLRGEERVALFALARGETAEAAAARRLARRSLVVDDTARWRFFSPLFEEYARERARAASRESTAVEANRVAAKRSDAARTTRGVAVDVRTGAVVAGRYVLEAQIGEGAFGAVWRAHDRVLGRALALKFLRSDAGAAGGGGAGAADGAALRHARFRREAQALAKMRHPNVVAVHDLGEWEGTPFLAMEYVDGGTVADLVARVGRLDAARAARIGCDVATGLAHAHALGIVHRDVKPANVMLERDGRARVADFGVMRDGASGEAGRYPEVGPGPPELRTGDGIAVGTPAYMAPEQLQGKRVDGRADVYGLGVTLFECVTGRRPFAHDSISEVMRMVLFEPAPDPRADVAELPAGFAAVLLRAMAKGPGERFATGEEMARALAPFANQTQGGRV